MGDTGMAFVALPQMAPRNVTWAKKGKWFHLAKIGLEQYFLLNMKRGVSERFFEKAILKAMRIMKLETGRESVAPSLSLMSRRRRP